MIYIKEFKTYADYEEYIATDEYPCPSISFCDDTLNEVQYNGCSPHDYSKDYLTFVALEDGTFRFSGNSVNYSLDNGETWTTLASNKNSQTVTAGSKIIWKGSLTPTDNGVGVFSSTGSFEVEGNPMSLLYGDSFVGQKDLTGKDNAFRNLLSGATRLTSAENMSLVATTLAAGCYRDMFNNCTSLTTVPELPAETLANSCYFGMFVACTSLTDAPSLPATTLAEGCYYEMFRDCTGLTTAPELPATTLAPNCYYQMFDNCWSLTTPPVLSAMTLANGCYGHMFQDCSGLTSAPALPATTLFNYCYQSMFYGCASLTTAPVLPATTLKESCYENMFTNCTSLTKAPDLPALTFVKYCYRRMFNGCTSLNYIKCLQTGSYLVTLYPTQDWVVNVSASGTFVKNASSEWITGTSDVPPGWTVQDAT